MQGLPANFLSLFENSRVWSFCFSAIFTIGIVIFWESSVYSQDRPVILDIDAGDYQTCVVTEKKQVYCWGKKAWKGATGKYPPTKISGDLKIAKIASGLDGTFGIDAAGKMYFWPTQMMGSPEMDSFNETLEPVPNLPKIRSVAVGWQHACAVTTENKVWCWGGNGAGELGDGTTTSKWPPDGPVECVENVKMVSAGVNNTCVLLKSGRVSCWGTDNPGRAGGGKGYAILTRTPGLLPDLKIRRMISNGRNSVCGINWQANIWCWASPSAMPKFRDSKIFRLDEGWNAAATLLKAPGWDKFVLIEVAFLNGCALTKKGRAFCWMFDQNNLEELKPFAGAKKVTIGGGYACALLPENTVVFINDLSKALETTKQDADSVTFREIKIPR
jgi:hypothetical protein